MQVLSLRVVSSLLDEQQRNVWYYCKRFFTKVCLNESPNRIKTRGERLLSLYPASSLGFDWTPEPVDAEIEEDLRLEADKLRGETYQLVVTTTFHLAAQSATLALAA